MNNPPGVRERVEAILIAKADAEGKDRLASVSGFHYMPGARARGRGLQRGSPSGLTENRTTMPWESAGAGWSAKVHATIDASCGMLASPITADQVADCPMMAPVLDKIRVQRPVGGRPRTHPQMALADKAAEKRIEAGCAPTASPRPSP